MSSCLSTQAVEQVSRVDQVGQMESNGLHSTKPSQMVKWCLNCYFSSQTVKQVSQIDQMESNELNHWQKLATCARS